MTYNSPLIFKEVTDSDCLAVAGNRHVLLNSLRCLSFANIEPSRVRLVLTAQSQIHLEQCLRVANAHDWRNVFILHDFDELADYAKKQTSYPFIRSLANFASTVRSYRKLFRQVSRSLDPTKHFIFITGFYAHPIERTIAKLIPNHSYLLVDDGNLTQAVNERRREELNSNLKQSLFTNTSANPKAVSYRIRILGLRLLARISIKGERSINFISDYQFDVQLPQDRLINLPARCATAEEIAPNLVHFLGMPAHSRDLVRRNEYREILKSLRDYFDDNGKTVVYFCHPAETADDIAPVKELLCPEEIIANQQPYEQTFCNLAHAPSEVVSFYSSTLHGLLSIKGRKSKIRSVKLPAWVFENKTLRDAVEKIYDRWIAEEEIDVIAIGTTNDNSWVLV